MNESIELQSLKAEIARLTDEVNRLRSANDELKDKIIAVLERQYDDTLARVRRGFSEPEREEIERRYALGEGEYLIGKAIGRHKSAVRYYLQMRGLLRTSSEHSKTPKPDADRPSGKVVHTHSEARKAEGAGHE